MNIGVTIWNFFFKILFLGTLYMYYAHGGDSLNFSCGQQGGSSVLVKSGFPNSNNPSVLQKMRELNPTASGTPNRSLDKLCNGQTRISERMSFEE